MSKVSIIIPARDEEATLGKVLEDLYKVIPQLSNHEFEVICVDDHSTDATVSIAQSFGAKVIENKLKSGKGTALRSGFKEATGDIFVMMDADYSHRPEDLPVFLDAIKDGIGLVIGSRIIGGSEEYSNIRALGNVFLSLCVGLFLGRYLSDALNGYKVFRRDVFTDFQYTSRAFEIEIEIIANTLRKNYRVIEVNSHERARAGGKMKSSVIRHGTRFFLRIFWERLKGIKSKSMNTSDDSAAA